MRFEGLKEDATSKEKLEYALKEISLY